MCGHWGWVEAGPEFLLVSSSPSGSGWGNRLQDGGVGGIDSSDCYKGVLKKPSIYLIVMKQHRGLNSNVCLLLTGLL